MVLRVGLMTVFWRSRDEMDGKRFPNQDIDVLMPGNLGPGMARLLGIWDRRGALCGLASPPQQLTA